MQYDLRELLNTNPESVVDFDVDECDERWGRAVDDWSPKIFEFLEQSIHRSGPSTSRDDLKNMDKYTYESLVMDITEARSFLFGARAC